jgi:T-complex protein 1 subunit gamma
LPFCDLCICSEVFFCFLVLAYTRALEDALAVLDKIAMPVDVNDRKSASRVLQTLSLCWINYFACIHHVLFCNLMPWIYHALGVAMLGLVKSSIGTKFTGQFGDLIAVSIVLLCQVSY